MSRLVPPEVSTRFRSIAVIAFCQVAAMALWVSATAVIPALKKEAAQGQRMKWGGGI